MAHLNHKGPEEKGTGTGRKLGSCNKEAEVSKLGVGMGMHRKSEKGKGKGKRLQSRKDKE